MLVERHAVSACPSRDNEALDVNRSAGRIAQSSFNDSHSLDPESIQI
jgi:hypothetical protein